MSFDLVSWLRRAALPLWAEVGFDAISGMFVERLDLDGHPLLDVPRRVMVQARQVFVFCEAQSRGWCPGGVLAERAGEAMVRVFRRDDGSWIFSASREAHPVDETRDLYAQAFVLLALASLARSTGSRRWLDLADATLAFLDTWMATPATGGYAETRPARPGQRRQNPHMHLVEALLALEGAHPGGGYRRRAETLIALLERRFLHGPNRVLVEFYDDELRPIGAPPFAFEPGHHFEWAWLLMQHAKLAGRSPPPLARRLCETARRFGLTADGVLFDEVTGDGRALTRSTRLWPCTEAIRATTLDLEGGPAAARAAFAHDLTEATCRRFLAPARTGCWIDHVDADGHPLAAYVPASSLYHLVGAGCALADLNAS